MFHTNNILLQLVALQYGKKHKGILFVSSFFYMKRIVWSVVFGAGNKLQIIHSSYVSLSIIFHCRNFYIEMLHNVDWLQYYTLWYISKQKKKRKHLIMYEHKNSKLWLAWNLSHPCSITIINFYPIWVNEFFQSKVVSFLALRAKCKVR